MPIRIDTAEHGFTIPWLHGTRARLPVRDADTGGAYSAQFAEIGPGYANPPHCHGREDEVFYVVDGEIELSVGPERVRLRAGELAFAPRGVPHQLHHRGEGPARLIVLLTPGTLEGAFVEASRDIENPEALGAAFARYGNVILETFDPDFVHPQVPRDEAPAAYVRRDADSPRVWMAGSTYTVLLPGEAAGDRLAVVRFDVPPGGGPGIPGAHVHTRDDEALFVLDGEVTVIGEGLQAVAGPGDVAWLPRGEAHAFRNETDRPAQVLAVVNPGGFDRLVREVGAAAVTGQDPPALDDAERARLIEASPRYGVELRRGLID